MPQDLKASSQRDLEDTADIFMRTFDLCVKNQLHSPS